MAESCLRVGSYCSELVKALMLVVKFKWNKPLAGHGILDPEPKSGML